ncbi:MAG: recombinase family protein [Cryobacterium sp.]|nr:recombinase family protein [Cryobacterium sp.]
MTKRAAIYARISKADKTVPKVANQILICKALAEDHGYEVAEIFEDDGIAASGKQIDDSTLSNRPGALRLLEAMRSGQFDILLAVEGERLARTYPDGMEFIKASIAGGVTWHLDTDGQLDPSTPAGEETAVSIFASGRREGRVRTARQKRRYDRERAAGMPLWGTRPFGYEEDRISLRPAEADLIRQAVKDYLEGTRSMLRIAQDWTAAGVLTDGMKRERTGRDGVVKPARQAWTATTVRQVLQRDRNAGILTHNGARMPESQIQPIIEEEELEALKARVKLGTPVGARAKSLLGGILRCECGAPMHGTVSYSQRRGGPRYEYKNYKCSQVLYDKSQRHASIGQATADDWVGGHMLRDLVTGKLDSPTSDIPVQLQMLTQRLTANAEAVEHVGGIIIDPSLKTLHAKARGQLKTLEAERSELEQERDSLLARVDDGGDLAALLTEWRDGIFSTFKTTDDWDQWTEKFNEVWGAVEIVKKQALIRARYRPTVKVGGRGSSRISLNPVEAS